MARRRPARSAGRGRKFGSGWYRGSLVVPELVFLPRRLQRQRANSLARLQRRARGTTHESLPWTSRSTCGKSKSITFWTRRFGNCVPQTTTVLKLWDPLRKQFSNKSLRCGSMRADSEEWSVHFVTPLAIGANQNTQWKGVKRCSTPEDPHRPVPTRNKRRKGAKANRKRAGDKDRRGNSKSDRAKTSKEATCSCGHPLSRASHIAEHLLDA